MLDLLKQKDNLLKQLDQYANAFGLCHPRTVRKSQELDKVITKLVFLDVEVQKRAG